MIERYILTGSNPHRSRITMPTTQPDTGDERYAELTLDDGSIVIYDTERPTAWLQSDAAVSPDAVA